MLLIAGRGNDHLNLSGMVPEEVVNGLGAFDDEGAFSLPNPFVAGELANACGLHARQKTCE